VRNVRIRLLRFMPMSWRTPGNKGALDYFTLSEPQSQPWPGRTRTSVISRFSQRQVTPHMIPRASSVQHLTERAGPGAGYHPREASLPPRRADPRALVAVDTPVYLDTSSGSRRDALRRVA
jgi:hypothetical protein